MDEEVAALLPARTGHFRLESGHHGDLWLELELLCFRTGPVRTLARELGRRVAQHDVEIICGPLVEGAFVALMVAEELGLPFTYSEPQRSGTALGLFPVTYRIPGVLRSRVGGRRVAVLNERHQRRVGRPGDSGRPPCVRRTTRGHRSSRCAGGAGRPFGGRALRAPQEAVGAAQQRLGTVGVPSVCARSAALRGVIDRRRSSR